MSSTNQQWLNNNTHWKQDSSLICTSPVSPSPHSSISVSKIEIKKYPIGTHSVRDFITDPSVNTDYPFNTYFPITAAFEPLSMIEDSPTDEMATIVRPIGCIQTTPMTAKAVVSLRLPNENSAGVVPQLSNLFSNDDNDELVANDGEIPELLNGISDVSGTTIHTSTGEIPQLWNLESGEMSAAADIPQLWAMNDVSSAAAATNIPQLSNELSTATAAELSASYQDEYRWLLTKQHCCHPNINSVKPWVCPDNDCETVFKNQKSLILHYRKHTQYAYVCHICNKRFGRKNNYNEHCRCHGSDRPFKCDLCQETFRQSHTLKHHYLSHSGEKPHSCADCSKRFRLRHNLKQHQESVHNGVTFSCDICDKILHSRQSLRRHKKTIHNNIAQ